MVYMEDGGRVGLVVDLAEAIATRLPVPVEIKYMEWSQAQQQVVDGKADAVLHINPTDERKVHFEFSHDLLTSDFSIFIQHNRTDIYNSSSLRGLHVGVLEKGLCFDLLNRDPAVNLVTFPEILPAYLALSRGELDAVAMDRQVGSFLLAEHRLRGIQIAGDPLDTSNSSIAVKKGNVALLAEINRALGEIRANGTYATILAKWDPKKVVFQTKEQTQRQEHLLMTISMAVVISVIIIFLGLFWTRSLNRMVSVRTRELQRSESKFRRLSDANVMGVIFWNKAGDITEANDEFLRMVGYTRDEVLSLQVRWKDMTPDEYAASDEMALAEIKTTGSTRNYEKEFFRKDGSRVPVLLGAAMLEESDDDGICYVLDLTERKRMETELCEREALMHTLLNAPLEIIMLLDRAGTVLSINEGGASRLGSSPEDMIGHDIYSFMNVETAQRRKNYGEQVVHSGKPMRFEDERAGRTFATSVYPVLDPGNEQVVNLAVFSSDITDRKKAEDQVLAHQDRLRALAAELTLVEERERKRIAAELHDGIGQTLAFARTRLTVIRKELSSEKATTALEDVSGALLETIRETKKVVFDLSSPSMNEIGLAAAIGDWLKERIEGVHGLKTRLEDRCGRIPLDNDRRALLFRNVRELLLNVTKHAQATQVSVSLVQKDSNLQISVEDDGVGIDLDALGDMGSNTGSFGLFSVRERMADMGGSLEIYSSHGEGCQAVLTIPVTHSS